MSRINVIYWSQTGNTEAMAGAVAKGIEAAGKEAVVRNVADVSVADLAGEEAIALGCPAMGAEVLEEYEMEPFMEELTPLLNGKKVALFGSYGWGNGEWMRDWENRVKEAGAVVVGGEGVICLEMPDDEALEACERIGKELGE